MWSSRSDPRRRSVTGIPVHIATTWAISSSSTVGWSLLTCDCHSARSCSTVSRAVAFVLAQAGRLVVLGVDRRVLLLGYPVTFLRLAQVGWRRGVAEADARRGLVDEVDRLVRQVPVGDVADREVDGGATASSVIATLWCCS